MQTLTLPLSVPHSACMLLKGNMALLKIQEMQHVFVSALFYHPDVDSDSQIIISALRLQSHSHAPACLHARPAICQLVALVCLSWHGGQHRVVMSTRALFPVCPEVKRHLMAVAVNAKHTATDRIKQRVGLSKCSWCHRRLDVMGCHPENKKETLLQDV